MDVQEFEIALSDLETRLDRLRALYENWFRGYEKLEPQVARKDVERRVYGMRKELPRNTALRFRYHQLYQRYTTLANYWQRTAKRVEEGTHPLQLQRLKRKKLRRGDAGYEPENELDREDGRKTDRPKSYELNLDESLSVDDLLDDLEMDAVARAVDTPGRHSEPPPPVRAFGTFSKPRRSDAGPTAGVVKPAPVEGRLSSPPAQQRRDAWEDEVDVPTGLHLSLDDAPPMPKRPAPSPSAPRASALDAAKPSVARPSLGDPPPAAARPAPTAAQASANGLKPAPSTSIASSTGAGPAPGAPFPTGARPAPSAPLATSAAVPGPAGARPAPSAALPSANGARTAPTAPASSAAGAPAPGANGARPPGANEARPAPSASTGTTGAKPVPPPPRPVPVQSGGTIVGRPPLRSPITSAGEPKPAPPPAAPGNDPRMRRIYDEYVAARRKNNEGDVRYEAMVSSIQKMLPELEKKHRGKQIDFEIVVKDGRVGLKPKAT